MNKIKTILITLCMIFCSSSLVYAGVAGSKHDMFAQKKGDDPDPCKYCHVVHNAAGEKIWSDWANEEQLTGGGYGTIGNMCYTCHDGTVTVLGTDTVFDLQNRPIQHTMPDGQGCDMCHTVHDNEKGNFMKVTEQQNSYCAACHNAQVNAGGLGDYTTAEVGNHPSYWTTPPVHSEWFTKWGVQYLCGFCHDSGTNSCNLCHKTVHGGTNLVADRWGNWESDFTADGDVSGCGYCHQQYMWWQWPYDGKGHPAEISPPGSWGRVRCGECHDPHQPGVNTVFLLRNTNIDSGYCTQCHSKTDETNGPKIGGGHPVNVAFTSDPVDPSKTPAGNAIDDNDKDGADYPGNSNKIICETCHSVHRKAVGGPLLRMDYSDSDNSLCLNCHVE